MAKYLNSTYCDVPGSPCLSKKGESNVQFVRFLQIHRNILIYPSLHHMLQPGCISPAERQHVYKAPGVKLTPDFPLGVNEDWFKPQG